MNSRLLLLALAASLAAPAIECGAAESRPYAYAVRSISGDSTPIQLGASQTEVARAIGMPHRQASDTVWLYQGYHATTSAASELNGCTTLVLTYADRRVVDMKLVNPAAAKVILAATRTGVLVTYVPDPKAGLLAVDQAPRRSKTSP